MRELPVLADDVDPIIKHVVPITRREPGRKDARLTALFLSNVWLDLACNGHLLNNPRDFLPRDVRLHL